MKVLSIVMAVSIVATVVPAQSSSGSSEDAPPSSNGNGCSSVPNNCDSLCLKIDASGCIICACSETEGNSSSSGLNSGSLTGSVIKLPLSAVMNLNGCPSFPAGCSAECASLDENSCAICTCPVSGGTSGSPGGSDHSTSISGGGVVNPYNHVSSGSTNNGNGCPAFSKDCPGECAAIDEHGCVVCRCTILGGTSGSTNSTSVSGGGVDNPYNHVNSGATNNGNGCPAFSKDCPGECAAIDENGCVVCRCTISGTPGSNGTSTAGGGGSTTGITGYHNEYNHLSPGSSNNNNNCPVFAESCPAECTVTNDDGCPVCTCSASGSTGGGSTTGGTKIDGQAVVCSPLDITCPTDCMHISNGGCILCKSDCKGTNSSGASLGSITANNNGCPIIDPNACKAECASFDAKGCLTCTCTETPQGGSTGDGNTSGNNHGTSSGTSSGGLGTSNVNHCPPFDPSCAHECTAIDSNGCVLCTCAVTDIVTTTTVHKTTTVPTVKTTTAAAVTSACPVFDTSCPPGCASLDEMQCLTCTCAGIVTTTAVHTTATVPTVPTTAAAVTSACPVFDTSCPPGCASMDEMQCLTCTCAASTASTKMTVATTTTLPFGNVNDCPSFDASCPANCVTIDVKGCLSCTCSGGTSMAPLSSIISSTTTLPLNQLGLGNGGCPPFDANCPAMCVSTDDQGCLKCTCAATSSQSLTTTQAPVTTPPTTTVIPPITTSAASATCPPLRCVSPCDAGVTIGADRCPICKCHTVSTTAAP